MEQLSDLSTSLEVGLSSVEANRRMQQFGPNEVQVKKNHPFIRLLKKFTTPSSLMLELIIVVSIFLHKYADLIVVQR
jgi:magnesium-transporting ATPase (P-type)